MRNKILGLFLLVLLVAFGAISCGPTTPDVVEPEPEPTPAPAPAPVPTPAPTPPPPVVDLSLLTLPSQRAALARQMVLDFNGNTYFPQEWADAEAVYNRAQSGGSGTVAEVAAKVALFVTAAGQYEELFEKTHPRYAEDLTAEVIQAWSEALRKDTQGYARGYISTGEQLALQADNQYSAKDYYAARDTGLSSRDTFRTIVIALEANQYREEAMAEGMEGIDYYGPYYLTKLDDEAIEALDLYDANGDAVAAMESALILRDAYKTAVVGTKTYYVREILIAEGMEQDPYGQLYLYGTDDVALEALDYVDAENYPDAYDLGVQLLSAYKVMVVGLEAYKIRMEIDEFYAFDADNLYITDTLALSGLQDYENRNIDYASFKADVVLARYGASLVATKGAYVAELGALATAERSRAYESKAHVAVRDDYYAAENVLIRGAQAYNEKNYDLAARNYNQSRDMFGRAIVLTLEKRRVAETAIQAAELRMAESDETAYRAELQIGGGAR